MKLASLCVYCLVSIAYALIPNQANAFELSLECDYLGPVINGTPSSGLVCELTWDPIVEFLRRLCRLQRLCPIRTRDWKSQCDRQLSTSAVSARRNSTTENRIPQMHELYRPPSNIHDGRRLYTRVRG